jgi:hypothetical protein
MAAKATGHWHWSLECYHFSFGPKITMQRDAGARDQPGARDGS